MRIIAGKFRGRSLDWPKTPLVRPMSQLVRESLFNIIGPVEGWNVLDAYAGSGSVGFEALSLGAAKAEAVEILRQAQASIRRNVDKLEVAEQYTLHAMPIEQWLRRPATTKFDLIVAGPPYAALEVGVMNSLVERLKPAGLMIVWHSSRIDPPELQSLKLTDTRTYGDSALSFYVFDKPN